MNNYTFYGAGRGGGKTTQMMRWVDEALSRGERVAVVVPILRMGDHILQRFLDSDIEIHVVAGESDFDVPYADLYSEATLDVARGMRYDCAFVDNADLFRDDPVWLMDRAIPGVPTTFTFTPSDPYDEDSHPWS